MRVRFDIPILHEQFVVEMPQVPAEGESVNWDTADQGEEELYVRHVTWLLDRKLSPAQPPDVDAIVILGS